MLLLISELVSTGFGLVFFMGGFSDLSSDVFVFNLRLRYGESETLFVYLIYSV